MRGPGYTFKGWYTASSGGTKVTSDYVFSGDATVYAQWTQNYTPPAGGGRTVTVSYTVTIEDSINGTVKADRTRTSAGTIVTLTVTPDTGYTLETLTVTPSSGKEVELTDKGNGQYTFKMPSSKVNVKATFIDDNTMLNFFVDVPADAYFYDAVLRAVKEGITNGTSATTFSPNNPCTRAQMATFLWRAATSPEPVGESNPFTDVRQMPTTQRQYSGPMSRVLPAAPALQPSARTIPAPVVRWPPSSGAILALGCR